MPAHRDLLEQFPTLRRLALASTRRRIPLVRQLATTDCGPAALAMVLGYYGKHISLEEVRQAVGIGRGGASAESLLRVGHTYGLRGRAVRADVDDLETLPAGAILHWKFNHFVVFDRVAHRSINVVDPSLGRRSIPVSEFARSFTGVALLFEPTEAFEQRARQPQRVYGLFKVIMERRDLLVRVLSISLVIQVLSLAMPLMTGVLIDRVVPRKDYSLLMVLAVGYCFCQIFNAGAGFVRAHLLIHLRTQLEMRFTLRFLDHLIDLPYAFFQHRTAGDLMVRLGSNNTIRELLTSAVSSAFMDGTMACVYLVLLLLAHAPIASLVILLAAVRLVLLALIRLKQRELLSQSLENQSRSQTAQVEMLSGMETLKAMGLERRVAENWSHVFVDGLNINISRARLDAGFAVVMSMLGTVSTLVIMFYGSYSVMTGGWTLGAMIAFNAVASGFLGPLNSLVSASLQLQMLEVYVERLNDVMDTPVEQNLAAVTTCGPLEGTISVENIAFRYNPQEPPVLQDVTLSIEAGMHVALVGCSGSGKSTLARVLAGLYTPASGRVLFDGKDLSTLELRSVRNQLGIVTQETQLFRGPIRRNIALSDPLMPLDQVVRAARVACIHDEIMAMPMGYETMLADRGMSLSGGQRQRLAIARALAGDRRILILDEATSHLDALMEAKLNGSLASLKCTRIVIAHRLSTIQDADLIVVLDGGRIIEQGTHEQLLTAQGHYAKLMAAQRDAQSFVRSV